MKRPTRGAPSSQGSPQKPTTDNFMSQLAEAQSEAQTLSVLQVILTSLAPQKSSRPSVSSSLPTSSPSPSTSSVAALFCDPTSNAPDLMFSLCRRYTSCISLVCKILGVLSESPEFGRRALRVRTNLAFMRFIPVHPPLAEVFESLITSHAQAFRQFAVDGEKVLADVLSHLVETPNITSLLSLLHVTHKLLGETPSKLQDRVAVFNSIGMAIASLKTQDFLLASMTDTRLQPATPGAWVWDALETVVSASFKHDSLVAPFEVACLLSISIINILSTISKQSQRDSSSFSSDRNGQQTPIFNVLLQQTGNENPKKESITLARKPKWEALLGRFLLLLQTQTSQIRLASPMTKKLVEAIQVGGPSALPPDLSTLALQVIGKWVSAGGWITPSVIDCSLIPFRRRVMLKMLNNSLFGSVMERSFESSTASSKDSFFPSHSIAGAQQNPMADIREMSAATTILIMCSGKGPEVTSRLKAISPAVFESTIRQYFGGGQPPPQGGGGGGGGNSPQNGNISPRPNGEQEQGFSSALRQMVALLVCFVHVSVYLHLCPLEAFFLPLLTHIKLKRITEKKFTELTRWQRNDQRDATIFEEIRRNLERINELDKEMFEGRQTITREWKAYYQQTILAQHQPTIVVLMKDPQYIQARKNRDECLADNVVRLEEKEDAIHRHRTLVEDDRNTQVADVTKKIEERIHKEKELYHKETDDIVWDADEKAQKELSHAAKLATISKGGDAKLQELSHVFEWRLRVCSSAKESLAAYERAKRSITIVTEKLEERERGRFPPSISTNAWVLNAQTSIEYEEDNERQSLVNRTTEGIAVTLAKKHRTEQLDMYFKAAHERTDIEEASERSVVELHCSFFSGIMGAGRQSQALRQQLQFISQSHDVLLSDWIGSAPKIPTTDNQRGLITANEFPPRSRSVLLKADSFSSGLISVGSSGAGGTPSSAAPPTLGAIEPQSRTSSNPSSRRSLSPIVTIREDAFTPKNTMITHTCDSTATFGAFVGAANELIVLEGRWRRYFLETFALQVFNITASATVFMIRRDHVQFTETTSRTTIEQKYVEELEYLVCNIAVSSPPPSPGADAFNSPDQSFNVRQNGGTSTKTLQTSNTESELVLQPPFAPTVGRIVACRKNQKFDLFELEMHRRKRIENMFDVARFQMASYLRSLTLQFDLIGPLIFQEAQSRHALVANSINDFSLLFKRKEWEIKYVVPLHRLIELERQERGALETEEVIFITRAQLHRPRGKRYRPPRNDDTPIKIPLEPAVASRVRQWQRQIAPSTSPMFAEVLLADNHTPTTKELLFGMAAPVDPIKDTESDTSTNGDDDTSFNSPPSEILSDQHGAAAAAVRRVNIVPPPIHLEEGDIDDVLSGAGGSTGGSGSSSERRRNSGGNSGFKTLPRPLQQQQQQPIAVVNDTAAAEANNNQPSSQQPFVSKLRGEVSTIQLQRNEKLQGLFSKLELLHREEVQQQEVSHRSLLLTTHSRSILERRAVEVVNSFSTGDRGLAMRRSTVSDPNWRSRAASHSSPLHQ